MNIFFLAILFTEMIEERKLKIYPHEHLLGTEGLLPNEINFLLDLSKSFENHLKNDKKKKV